MVAFVGQVALTGGPVDRKVILAAAVAGAEAVYRQVRPVKAA